MQDIIEITADIRAVMLTGDLGEIDDQQLIVRFIRLYSDREHLFARQICGKMPNTACGSLEDQGNH